MHIISIYEVNREDICSKYKNAVLADEARSIRSEDINRITGYVLKEEELDRKFIFI